MAQSLFMTLKERFPECRIDVLAPGWTQALLERMPEVNQGVKMPLGHGEFGFMRRLNLGKQLQASAYDRAIILPGSWKAALIPYFAKIPNRTGFLGEQRWGLLNDIRILNKRELSQTVQRFVVLGFDKNFTPIPECPTPKLTVSTESQKKIIAKFNLPEGKKRLVMCPGAEYGPAKQWPTEYFSEIARHQLKDGWDVWLIGSEKDRILANEINGAAGNGCLDFCGETNLAEAVDLLSLADVVLSNDSGLMHVAAALDKKLIALYGSSDPGFTPPLSERAHILYLNMECSPCFKRVCPLGHFLCLKEITPDQVLRNIH